MDSQNIIFKGTKDGVILMVSGASDYRTIKQAIDDKINIAADFFKNGNLFIDFSNSIVDEKQQGLIKRQIHEEYDISIQDIDVNKTKMFSGIYEGKTKFIMNTIRSGQNIEFFGNVVIIGDVNAGGQVTAGGNIVVLGALRGVVHAGIPKNAGALGNEKAIIAAFSLQPTQLRIADKISRAPDGEIAKPKCPELARIKDGCIVIEPYLPDKFY